MLQVWAYDVVYSAGSSLDYIDYILDIILFKQQKDYMAQPFDFVIA